MDSWLSLQSQFSMSFSKSNQFEIVPPVLYAFIVVLLFWKSVLNYVFVNNWLGSHRSGGKEQWGSHSCLKTKFQFAVVKKDTGYWTKVGYCCIFNIL